MMPLFLLVKSSQFMLPISAVPPSGFTLLSHLRQVQRTARLLLVKPLVPTWYPGRIPQDALANDHKNVANKAH